MKENSVTGAACRQRASDVCACGFLRRCRKRFGPHPSAVEHRLIGAEERIAVEIFSPKAFAS